MRLVCNYLDHLTHLGPFLRQVRQISTDLPQGEGMAKASGAQNKQDKQDKQNEQNKK